MSWRWIDRDPKYGDRVSPYWQHDCGGIVEVSVNETKPYLVEYSRPDTCPKCGKP